MVKQVTIFYFSGTGNTKWVTEQLAEALNTQGECLVQLIAIEHYLKHSADYTLPANGLVGIAYPIYGFGTPRIVTEFAEKLIDVVDHPQQIFLLKTAADYIAVNHYASLKLIKRLKQKGHEVFYDRIIAMGSNFMESYDQAFIKQLADAAVSKTTHMATELLNHTPRHYAPPTWGTGIAHAAHFGESVLFSPYFGKSLKANPDCNGCGKCARQCPADNIQMQGQVPQFGKQCLICMRCIYGCPTKAIYSKRMDFVILKQGYNLNATLSDEAIQSNFVSADTKNSFKRFWHYLQDPSL